ncbi:multiple inositol polyphosphate phosphatase 1-like [Planococcus citri]|uniref:multiple inositol polyphosphate phosphatase 1-like n=1 Tax=Planococcus citri TaxID=170843 RepID=UPI0031F86E05
MIYILLRSRKDCAKWGANNKESDEFISSPVFQLLRSRISYRLGFTYPISTENVTALYESCVFWNNLPAIWKPQFCAAFTPDDLRIMEYYLDLKHFYEFGYGNPLSQKMGCPLVKDMMNKLSNAAKGTFGKKGTFYFADEENFMGFITKMGLFRDEKPPKHDNYNLQKQNRKWRSSLLSPSIATTHVILFNCKNVETRVEFYINEKLIKLDACKSTSGNKCPLNTFLKEVENNFKGECEEGYCGSFPKSASSMTSCSLAVVISCYLFSKLRLV